MKPRVLIAPAPLKEIEPVYGPAITAAGAELVFPKRTVQMTEAELLDQLPGCVASLAGSEPYTRAVIAAAAAKGLKVIARAGVGYDAVDLAAATDHGVVVTFAPGTNENSVAEHTFTLILALARNLIQQHNPIAAGQWPRRANLPLRGTTLGVLGLGRIGKAVARVGQGFQMTVVGYDPFADAAHAAASNITLVPMDDVFRQADWVSLHMPMTPESKQCVNARTLGLMKPTAFLINTARGGVVNEPDLYEALKNKRIAGAGLDVFDEEPPGANPLLTLDNIVMTAHTAGVDLKSRDDMARAAGLAIAKLIRGEWPADWVVNPAVKAKYLAR
ncbi:MAG TPA: phosphoglycerate dehydrogenase [Urbifossiella sp.]|jgi:phosphoglycerate dehydrogenase-like enzyme|nr:phosphoglycerate dehydrogenase [Urbifossiella sp.]